MKSKSVVVLFYCHIVALLFGLAGLLIALPHPQLWMGNTAATLLFNFGIMYAGSLHILLGAATLLVFGVVTLGKRKTLIFFFISTLLSLSMELLGTSTGFPFGPYAYTDLLGYKILGHVPYSIPLSWFYMGLTAYLLGAMLVARAGWRAQTLWSVVLGVYFLTVWDLSLDPSMANTNLQIQFWHWATPGPYFGMPIRNLVGWSVTGLLFMGLSRLLWREQPDTSRIQTWLLWGMYVANTGFAMLLALGAGLWQPLVIGAVLGVLPATLLLRPCSRLLGKLSRWSNALTERCSWLAIETGSRLLLARRVICTIEGEDYLPKQGAVLIVARHYHHLYDGCALLRAVPRRLHMLVGLDWVRRPLTRTLMELACRLVAWPVVLRTQRLAQMREPGKSAYRVGEAFGYLRRAVDLSAQLLSRGEVLVIFPEGFPVIDPQNSLRKGDQPFLPFHPGFARLIELAQADRQTHVAIVPAGLSYWRRGKRWHIRLCFGSPLFAYEFPTRAALVQAVERRVHSLSQTSNQPTVSDSLYPSEGESHDVDPIRL